MSVKVKLTNVRLFFPDLFTAVEFTKGDKKPRYNATFGVLKTDKAQIKLVNDAIMEVAEEAWKGKAKSVIDGMRGNVNKFCFVDGDAKTYDGVDGSMLLSAHRKEKDGPPVRLTRGKQVIDEDKGELYSGCYVVASVEIWAQSKGEGAPGIRCGLLGVQFYADGDSFSGASKPNTDDFEELAEGSNAEDLV